MTNNITELVFILDKSGSMYPLVHDTVGGYNSMLAKQRKEPGTAYVTTTLFNESISCVHDRLTLDEIPDLTEDDYIPGGCTALIDAIGSTIEHIETIHKYAREEDVPEKTVFVIITDGKENTSHIYNIETIKSMIETKQTQNQWEFIFLGANIDAIETASSFGIRQEQAANFHADDQGMTKVFEAVSCAVSSARCARPVDAKWKKDIEKDFNTRERKK